jgi:hypothetical protein
MAVRIFPLLASLSLLSGCAYTYVDTKGTTHMVGLMAVEVPSANPPNVGASAIRVENIGLSVIRSDISSSISLGYNVDEITVIENNACVWRGPVPAALAHDINKGGSK